MKIDRLTPNPVILVELGQRLAQVRKHRGYSQEALAQAAGVGVATLRRIEDGKDGKLGSWLRLLKALEMEAGVEALLPENFRSPMAEVRGARKRGRRGAASATDFVWGDERP